MIRFGVALTFILLLFLSCGERKTTDSAVPPGILDEETFTKVLRDFALAESAASMNIKSVNVQKMDSVYAFDPLRDNNVSKAQYDSTVTFYAKHPDLYKKIYENVLVELSEMETKRNPAKRDSISK